ncbi:hypothetical protein JCM8115_003631 [Rhodotorula mucilaginosa]
MESDPHNSIVAAASISKQLLESGCTTRSVEQLDRLFSITCTALLDACSKHYEATVSRLWALSPEDNNRRKEWDSSVRTAFERKYETGVEAYCQVILQQVRAARLRHSTSPSPPPAPTTDAATTTLSGHFTPAITALLQSAYDAHATGALPNKGERRELARATGLTEKQVVTWFGNTRQRQRKRRGREASGGAATSTTTKRTSARSVPYSLDMAPQHRRRESAAEQRYPSSMQHPPQQSQQRTWSFGSSSLNSSVGSSSTSSLDLVEYAESAQDDATSVASAFLPPAPAPPAPANKVQFDVSTALDPSGWFSVASSTASPPASVTVADVTPRPPQQADAFLSLPAPAFAADQFTPAASSSSGSSPSSIRSPSAPHPLDSFPTLAVADDELPYVPAPNDAWMDDEFYRNLFSSLGFEMEIGIGRGDAEFAMQV